MVALYLNHNGFELRPDGKAIALYENGKRLQSLPSNLIERVVVQGEILFSAGVIDRLVDGGASIIFISKRTHRHVATVLGRSHNDAKIRLGQYAAVSDPEICNRFAKSIVRKKIGSQKHLLCDSLVRRLDNRHSLITAIRRLNRLLTRLKTPDQHEIPVLMGIEGAAASAYFSAFAKLFAASLGFTSRVRRPPTDPVNATLSLTYTLLHHEAIIYAHLAGLDPFVGFLHSPSHGRASLACDFVELNRARSDKWVNQLFLERRLRKEHFHTDKGRCLLTKTGRNIYYPEFEAFAVTPRRSLRRIAILTAKNVKRYVGSEGLSS